MKNTYTFIIALFVVLITNSETNAQNNFKPILPMFNIGNNAQYRIEAKTLDGSPYNIKFTVSDVKSNKDPVSFELLPFTKESFESEMKKALKSLEADNKFVEDAKTFENLHQVYLSALITAGDNYSENVEAGTVSIYRSPMIERTDAFLDDNIKLKLKHYTAKGSYRGLVGSLGTIKEHKIKWGFLSKSPNTGRTKFFRRKKYCSEGCNKAESWNIKRDEKTLVRQDYIELYGNTKQQIIKGLEDEIKPHLETYDINKVRLNELNNFQPAIDKDTIIKNIKNSEALIGELKQKQYETLIKSYEIIEIVEWLKNDSYFRNALRLLGISNIEINEKMLEMGTLQRAMENIQDSITYNMGRIVTLESIPEPTITAADKNLITSLKDENNSLEKVRVNVNILSGLLPEYWRYGAQLERRTASNAISNALLQSNVSIEEIRKEKISVVEDVMKQSANSIKPLYFDLISHKRQLPKQKIEIADVEIEFLHGLIENIKVWGVLKFEVAQLSKYKDAKYFDFLNESKKDERILFYNHKPIGFSSPSDFKQLNKIFLKSNPRAIDGKSIIYSLRLTDILSPDYDFKLAVERRDYSPANNVIEFEEGGRNQQPVYKEQTSKLFAAKVYSDLVGFSKDKPNGLVQVEVEKRLNIRTSRHSWGKRAFVNSGWFSYTKPMLVLSKIEENGKGLSLGYIDNFNHNLNEPIKYASTLDLYQHEVFSIGNEMNLFLLDSRPMKSTLYVDFGFQFSQTKVIDSLWYYEGGNIARPETPEEKNIDALRFYPKLKLTIYPDERYNFSATYSHSWYYARTNDFEQVANSDYFASTGDNSEGNGRNQFNSVELTAKIKLDKSTTGNWFVRYRYNWQQRFWNTGFSQLQVGYKLYIMTSYKSLKSQLPK